VLTLLAEQQARLAVAGKNLCPLLQCFDASNSFLHPL